MTQLFRHHTECFPLRDTYAYVLLCLYYGFLHNVQYRSQVYLSLVLRSAVNPFLKISFRFFRFDSSGLRVILNSNLQFIGEQFCTGCPCNSLWNIIWSWQFMAIQLPLLKLLYCRVLWWILNLYLTHAWNLSLLNTTTHFRWILSSPTSALLINSWWNEQACNHNKFLV